MNALGIKQGQECYETMKWFVDARKFGAIGIEGALVEDHEALQVAKGKRVGDNGHSRIEFCRSMAKDLSTYCYDDHASGDMGQQDLYIPPVHKRGNSDCIRCMEDLEDPHSRCHP